MKTKYFLIAIGVVFTIASCSKEDVVEEEQYESLVQVFNTLGSSINSGSAYFNFNPKTEKITFTIPYRERFDPSKMNPDFPIPSGIDQFQVDLDSAKWSECYNTIFNVHFLDVPVEDANKNFRTLVSKIQTPTPRRIDETTAEFQFVIKGESSNCIIASAVGPY